MLTMTEQTPATDEPAPVRRSHRTAILCVVALVVLAGVVGAAIMLSRGNSPKAAETAALSPTPSATGDEITPAQNSYLYDAREIYPADTDTAILELGDSICGALNSGLPMREVVESVTGLDVQTRLELFFAATNYLCSAHVQGFIAYRAALPATIGDGTWTVGSEDLAAGRYRVAAPAAADCYWAILRSGSNGADIISNNIGGGRPTVTLTVGQDFETRGCGTWEKVK